MNNMRFIETNHDFMERFVKSVQLKDWGMLRSSLGLRTQATEQFKQNLGMYALGKTNEAILLCHHIGNGLMAYEAAKESMKNIEAMVQVDKDWQSCVGFSLIHDCLGLSLFLANSYDEAEQYCRLAGKYDPNDDRGSGINLDNLTKSRAKGTKWWKVQFGMAHNFYSRATPSRDAGKNAAAMSILHCIIARACDEKHGYEIDQDELFDILDDYLALSLHLYNGVFMKFSSEIQKRNQIVMHANGPDEQYIVYEEPLKYWLELMPDCPEKWKKKFKMHCEMIMSSPFPIFPEIMDRIGGYFPDAQIAKKKCLTCGFMNSEVTPICVKCGSKFLNPVEKQGFFGRWLKRK